MRYGLRNGIRKLKGNQVKIITKKYDTAAKKEPSAAVSYCNYKNKTIFSFYRKKILQIPAVPASFLLFPAYAAGIFSFSFFPVFLTVCGVPLLR